MIYGTGGVAMVAARTSASLTPLTGAFWSGHPSSTRVGWTIGGGVEYAITNNVTIKGEYLYADLGSSSFNTVGNAAAATFFPGVFASGKVAYNASIFRGGVNYKFGQRFDLNCFGRRKAIFLRLFCARAVDRSGEKPSPGQLSPAVSYGRKSLWMRESRLSAARLLMHEDGFRKPEGIFSAGTERVFIARVAHYPLLPLELGLRTGRPMGPPPELQNRLKDGQNQWR